MKIEAHDPHHQIEADLQDKGLSHGAVGLLGILVRARGAGAAASVFFLMPPVTAVLAWLILGETLGPREIAGLVITVVGVAAATRTTAVEEFKPVAPEPEPDPD